MERLFNIFKKILWEPEEKYEEPNDFLSRYSLQGSFYLDPEDIKTTAFSLKDTLIFYIWTNKKYSILESELPLSFVLEYKPKLKSYGAIIIEIESLVSMLKREKNSIFVRLRKDLSNYITFKKKV
jgi:hypothetical protein